MRDASKEALQESWAFALLWSVLYVLVWFLWEKKSACHTWRKRIECVKPGKAWEWQGACQTCSSMEQPLKCMASLGSHSSAFIPWKTAQMHGSTGQLLKCVAAWYSDSLRHSLLLFPTVSASLQRSSSRIPSPTSPHSLTVLQHPQRPKKSLGYMGMLIGPFPLQSS